MKLKRIVFLWLLVAVSGLILFADFFHTEDTLEPDDHCPICIWERNVIAISQLYFLFVLALFVFLFHLLINQSKLRFIVIHYYFNSRAPPSFQAHDRAIKIRSRRLCLR
jgi:hypothetical protein